MPRSEPLQYGEVLLSREYTITRDEEQHRVQVRLAIPQKQSDGRYECGAELTHNGLVWVWPMNGADALQALILALKMIDLELELISRGDSAAIQWLGGTERGPGLWEDT
jgi:hypothetical protein